MKKIYAVIFIFMMYLSLEKLQAQNPGVQLAHHIAKKMKDTLNLSNQKRNQVFAVNMHLHNKKKLARQEISNPDSLRIKIQRIENKRDSMYRKILPPTKYQLYFQKKSNLVSAN